MIKESGTRGGWPVLENLTLFVSFPTVPSQDENVIKILNLSRKRMLRDSCQKLFHPVWPELDLDIIDR